MYCRGESVLGADKRTQLALFHLSPAEMADFVACDRDLLNHSFRVRPLLYRGTFHGWPDALRIFWAVARTHANVSWFAYNQAYFAVRFSRLLGKRSLVIVGGFDVAVEERPAGTIPARDAKRLSYTLNHASSVFAVSERLLAKTRAWTSRNDIQLVPLGFDGNKFTSGDSKDGSVVTTAYIRRDNVERKGLRFFVQAASEFPESQFYVIGKALDESVVLLKRDAPSNVTFTGWLEEREMVERLRNASVYVQASLHEGFGSALAQATLCECVPVVTRAVALPEVVGPAGIYIPTNSPADIAAGVRAALAEPAKGKMARSRVLSQFSLDRRMAAFLNSLRNSGNLQPERNVPA